MLMSLLSFLFGSDPRVITLINELRKQIVKTQAEVDQLTNRINKISTEVQTAKEEMREQIRLLQEQIDNGTSPAELNFDGLNAAVDSLDNIHPDAEVA